MHVPCRPPSIGFVAQLTNRNLCGIEAQTKKSSRWFWGTNHQTGATGFEAQPRNPKPPILRPNREKPLTLVLRPNQETHAPHLLIHGADHTRRHPTSWSPGHQVPDLCLTIPSPLHQVSYSCHIPHHCLSCCTCHLHTMRQANTILHMNKGNIAEPRKCPTFEFKRQRVNDSSHIKPRYWPLGFSISPLMSPLTTKSTKFEVQIQDPMKHS
jgi:hypothetical protein